MKITLTEALNKLKLINKRIEKAAGQPMIGALQNGKVGALTKVEFQQNITSNIQSFQKLMDNYTLLKSAIISTNAVTEVIIDGEKYTIATAIARKQRAEEVLEYARLLAQQYDRASRQVISGNNDTTANLAKHLKDMYGEKPEAAEQSQIKESTEAFEKRWGWSLLSPTNTDFAKFIEEMVDDTQNFLSDIDTVLAVANATTMIDVDIDS